MVNNSISGTSLAFVVLMFLSSFGACTKLTRCSRFFENVNKICDSNPKDDPYKDLETHNHNLETLIILYEKYKEVKIGNDLKLVLPDIAKRLNDTRGYDNIFEIRDATNHFLIQTKNQTKSENGIVEDWLTFRQKISLTHTLLRIPTLIDSIGLQVDKNGYLTKAYQYRLYNETVQGLVKLIETEYGFTFIEIETPVAKNGFYELSDMLLQAAIMPESAKLDSDSIMQPES